MSTRARSVTAIVAVAVFILSEPAFAQKTAAPSKPQLDQAQSHFKRGVELFDEQDYTAALIEFRRAYQTAPNYRVLYNIGNTCFQLTDYACALRSLEKYLSDGGADVPAPRKADVERDIGKLKLRVAKIEIKTNVPGADIAIDDTSVGKAPLSEPVLVSAGRRRITATVERRAPVTKTVEIAGGDALSVSLDFVEDLPAPVSPPPTSPQPSAMTSAPVPEPDRALPMALWIGAGVAVAGATATGILALGASSDLKAKRDTAGVSASDLSSAASRAKTFALVTDVLGVAAVGLVGAAGYFTFFHAPTAKGATTVGFSGTGVVLNHTF